MLVEVVKWSSVATLVSVTLLWISWCKDHSALLEQSQNLILWLRPQEKNDLRTEQTVKEWACSEYTERSTVFLTELRESVIRIMHSISILLALAIPGLIANSSVSKAVIWLAKTLENNTYCSSL